MAPWEDGRQGRRTPGESAADRPRSRDLRSGERHLAGPCRSAAGARWPARAAAAGGPPAGDGRGGGALGFSGRPVGTAGAHRALRRHRDATARPTTRSAPPLGCAGCTGRCNGIDPVSQQAVQRQRSGAADLGARHRGRLLPDDGAPRRAGAHRRRSRPLRRRAGPGRSAARGAGRAARRSRSREIAGLLPRMRPQLRGRPPRRGRRPASSSTRRCRARSRC